MEVAAPTEAESAYLDAARERILAVGWRRTTLTDVAKGAGVSRMTIYRRWPDMQALLGDLLVREWTGLLDASGITDGSDGASGREILARAVPAMVAAVRGNELFSKIVELDPDLLHPYLFERLGRNQSWILDVLGEVIRSGQADGSVRAGDAPTLARALLLACHGFVLSARIAHTTHTPLRRIDDELGTIVDRYLAP